MHVTCRTFWLPKGGNTADEYEDAFATHIDATVDLFRCAVSDGATETSFAALWAALLAESYVKADFTLATSQEIWHKHVSALDLNWYAEEKARLGAFAAIVGLTIKSAPSAAQQNGNWECLAVGDCCLFHIRNKQLMHAIPLDDWRKFDSSPFLLSTAPERNKNVADNTVTSTGTWEAGDFFYLMSDAAASWFLRRQAERRDAIKLLSAINSQEMFSALVSRQRAALDGQGRPFLRNDDITVMSVRPFADSSHSKSKRDRPASGNLY